MSQHVQVIFHAPLVDMRMDGADPAPEIQCLRESTTPADLQDYDTCAPEGEVLFYNRSEWAITTTAMTVMPDGSFSEEGSGTSKFVNWFQEKPAFHPFPRLPLELRRQIWKHALPAPSIFYVRESSYIYTPYIIHVDIYREKHSVAKSLILACRESNKLFLENYTHVRHLADHESASQLGPYLQNLELQAEGQAVNGLGIHIQGRNEYFDLSRDTIFLGDVSADLLHGFGFIFDASSIKHLAFTRVTLEEELESIRLEDSMKELIQQCSRLDSLRIVLQELDGDVISLSRPAPAVGYEPCFLEVDEDFLEMLPAYPAQDISSCCRRYHWKAERCRTRVSALADEEGNTIWKHINFKMSVVALEYDKAWSLERTPERLDLVPLHPRYYGVRYWTNKPRGKMITTMLRIEVLDSDVFCFRDGTLVTDSNHDQLILDWDGMY